MNHVPTLHGPLGLGSIHLAGLMILVSITTSCQKWQPASPRSCLQPRKIGFALGVLQEAPLTTGQLPFVSDDPLEIVHAHLAVVPPDPTRLDDAVPATISRIILKLMSKTPEERYQSAAGLCRDLERCASEWREKHEIGNFPLGTYDPSLKLRIPRKLYGREKDVAAMLSVFNEVAEGASALLLIAGHSGVGKSSLVHEMFLPISERRGFFLEGKFEQYRRDIPFLAWRQALDGFVRFLLRCPENELAVWRQALQQALAGNGRVMTELLPNLELIIGPQPPVTELKGQEALNRFAYVAQQFVSALAHAQHPLVIFLDDLQWIDAASLGLLQSLLSDTALTHALFVGAYRDSEVAPGDALTAAIADLESRKVNVHRLSVRNLEPGEVDSLIGDALPDALSDSASLARLVYARSGGNAFFVHQVLHLLQEGDYWDFDPLRGVWHLDQDKANALQLTDNVVDLLVEKIRGQLSADLAQFLAFAACIGNRFDLSMLDRLSSHRLADVRQVLRLAIRDAWITTDAGDFVFSHDRVQQAFYQLIPQEERQKNHLQIARTLFAGDEVPEEWIFDAANHLGHCLALVSERDERYRFSDLSRIAGEKANRTAAYETSFRYYLQAIELLPAGHWQERHAASVELFLGAAEAAFLVGRFSEMERFCQAVTAASSAVLDRIKVCEILVSGKLAQTRLQEAMDIGIAALRLLGVDFPAQIEETHWQTWRDRVGASLAARPVSALIDAPEMTDQNALMKLRILSRLLPAVYKFSPDHLPLITAEMAMASIEYGNTGLSAFGYSCHGMILVGFFADYETAWAYAHLSRAIIDRYGARNVIPRAYQIIEATIRHWKEHAAATIAPLEMAYHCGLETGDLEYASYCAEFEAIHRYLLGEPLLSLRSKMDAYAWTIEKTGQTVALNHHRPVQQAVHNLLGEAVDSATLRGSALDESSELATLVAYNDRLCLLIVYLQKILLALVFRQPKRAGEFAIAGAQYADGAPGCFVLPFFQAYELLALIGASRVDPAFADQCVKRLIAAFSARLSAAAQQAPMNYRHLFDLVTAESAALEGRDAEAQAGYEKAIDGANQGGLSARSRTRLRIGCRVLLASWAATPGRLLYLQCTRRLPEMAGVGQSARTRHPPSVSACLSGSRIGADLARRAGRPRPVDRAQGLAVPLQRNGFERAGAEDDATDRRKQRRSTRLPAGREGGRMVHRSGIGRCAGQRGNPPGGESGDRRQRAGEHRPLCRAHAYCSRTQRRCSGRSVPRRFRRPPTVGQVAALHSVHQPGSGERRSLPREQPGRGRVFSRPRAVARSLVRASRHSARELAPL